MNLLIDTHALIWAATEPTRLSERAADAIANPDNSVWVSAVSGWEIAIKRARGWLRFPDPTPDMLHTLGFVELPVTLAHAAGVACLDDHHRDPFDRMLVAQANHEGLTLVSADRAFADYDVRILW